MAAPASQQLARNSALYFSSLAIPAVAAVFLVPVTIRALGPTRFGLLALGWAVAEGSGMLDFGLGRATVRFVADATGRGVQRVGEIVTASFLAQAAAGVVAGLLLFLLTPLLVTRVFSIAPAVLGEATRMFGVLALHLPVLMAAAALRAALEGAQRFDVSAALRIPGAIASIAVPAGLAAAGYSLPAILWCLLAVRLALLIVSTIVVMKTLLKGNWRVPSNFRILREMLSYSGWVAVSTALGPLLGSFDRYVVGSVVGVTALGFYTGAAEAANRFLLIPVTAFSALLPALAATDATGARDRALTVTRAARRQMAALLFPLCAALFVFAPAVLSLWLGDEFARTAGTALRILAVGVYFNGLAHLPLALLYGSNRPDLPAKVNLAEIVVYLPLTVVLVRAMGIAGAALSWTIRCAADVVLYELVSRRALGSCREDASERKRTARLIVTSAGLSVAMLCSFILVSASPAAAMALALAAVLAYAAISWSSVLSGDERLAWTAMLLRHRANAA